MVIADYARVQGQGMLKCRVEGYALIHVDNLFLAKGFPSVLGLSEPAP